MRLVLASASPRRAELLRTAGFVFETLVVDVDESLRPGEPPRAYVERLAREKSARALEIAAADDVIVLGADTAVVVDDEILGKPTDDDDARRMLRRLSGRDHEVLTGVNVRTSTGELAAVEVTVVWFSALSKDDVEWYVARREGADKAGGYAIQGLASRFIPRIAGSYSNVVGLPVARVAMLLDQLGCRR